MRVEDLPLAGHRGERVAATYQQAGKRARAKKIVILFVAANPFDHPSLQIDKELELIETKIRQSQFQKQFDIRRHSSLTTDELQGFLLQHTPNIVHFSGHGSPSGAIILETDSGPGHPVPPKALEDLFSLLAGDIRCVVLNACYSELQARAIAKHVECVIGMSNAITDLAAIRFAASFYQALGYGLSVKIAFDLACNELSLQNIREENTPTLLASIADPKHVVFAGPNKLARALVASSESKRLKVAQELVTSPQAYLTDLLIIRSATDPSATVRQWINLALGKIGSAAAVRTLRKNIEDPDPFASLGAQDALRQLEEESRAVPDPSGTA